MKISYNLQTVFTVRDNATSKIKQITKHIEQLNTSMGQLSTRFNQTYSDLNRLNSGFNNVAKSAKLLQSTVNQLNGGINQLNGGVNNNTKTIIHNTTVINNNSSTINRNTNTVNNNTNNLTRNNNIRNTWISTINRENGALGNLGSTLTSLAGLYAAATVAQKGFNATIGAAANYEQSEVAVKAIFNDDEASKAYLKMVDKMAIDSPLLNSGDMLKSSKGLVAMTKDVGELTKAWSIIERLMALDPTKGTEGAAFALKEMWQGDNVSMKEQFGLNNAELNRIKKLDVPTQIKEIGKLLDGMGITQATVDAMGKTTLGYWSQIQERADKFGRLVGESGNTKLGKVLGDIVATLDNVDLDSMAKRFGDALGTVVDKAINVGKWMWKWREPLAWAVGAITAAGAAFVGIGVISALANPISLIAAGIGAAGVGMKALYDNSETFRGAVDGIIGKVKELFGAFKSGGLNGLIDAILPKDASAQVQHVLGNIRGQISILKHAFNTGGMNGVIAELFPPSIAGVIQGVITQVKALWGAFQSGGIGGVADMLFGDGTFEAVTAKFNEIKTFITTKIEEMQPGFETLKGVFTSVWGTISSVFSTVWEGVLKPGLANFWAALQILGDVVTIVFNNVIAPGLQFAATLFSVLWSVAGPILSLLGSALSAAFAVLKFVWDTILTPLVEFILGGVKNAFEAFTDAVNVVGGAFDWIGGIIDSVADKISDFVSAIKNVKLPDWVTKGVSATVKWVGNAIGATPDGSHRTGLLRVPFDGYLAELHKGERVLTRQEADAYSAMSNQPIAQAAKLPQMQQATMPMINNVINVPQLEPVTNAITNVFKPFIDVATPAVDNVIIMPQRETPASINEVTYEQASAGITNNHSTTNTYNTVATAQGKEQSTQPQRNISIAKLAEHIVVRQEADIDRIADGLVRKLIAAEEAGVS